MPDASQERVTSPVVATNASSTSGNVREIDAKPLKLNHSPELKLRHPEKGLVRSVEKDDPVRDRLGEIGEIGVRR